MSANLKSLPSRILIIEDDPIMRLGLKQLLSSQPQKLIVEMAEDGDRGVKAALSLKPDLAIIDVGMPHLDGIAATQQIKTALPDVKVVMLTSHTADMEIIAALSSGESCLLRQRNRLRSIVNGDRNCTRRRNLS